MTKTRQALSAIRLGDLLRHNAHYFPHKAALRLDAREVSNQQLLSRVQAIAQLLGPHIQEGERVALWYQNSLNWLASFIAINTLGAVSVPINTRLTPTELEIILKDVQPKALITSPSYRGRTYEAEAREVLGRLPWATLMLVASTDEPDIGWPLERLGSGTFNLDIPSLPDLMCIQYTSGTTSPCCSTRATCKPLHMWRAVKDCIPTPSSSVRRLFFTARAPCTPSRCV